MTDFEGLIRRLRGADVRFVLVGGFAGTVFGSPRVTVDLDIVYARDADKPRVSRARLGASLALPARRAGRPSLSTRRGDAGARPELRADHPQSIRIRVFDTDIDVVTLVQLIRLKRAAGRPKDLGALAELEALLEEQRGET